MIIIIIIIIYFLSVSYQLVTSDASVLPITTRLNNIIFILESLQKLLKTQ